MLNVRSDTIHVCSSHLIMIDDVTHFSQHRRPMMSSGIDVSLFVIALPVYLPLAFSTSHQTRVDHFRRVLSSHHHPHRHHY